MSEPLRQPVTFWQWLTGQPGNLFVPPPTPLPPPPKTALDYIESEQHRIHYEMESMREDEYVANNASYHKLIDALNKLNEELVRRSKEEN